MNKLQILERLKSQGVVFQCGHFFTPLSVCIFPVLHLTYFECSVALIWAMQLWNNNNDRFKGHCTSFQAVARVNSVGYNSTLFCRCLANFGKLLKSVNDVNMTRTMSHDPKKALKLLRILCFLFVLAASVKSRWTDAQRNGIHFLMRKREEVKIGGSEMFLLIFFLAREDFVPPPLLPPHYPIKPVIRAALHSQSRPLTR